MKRSLIRCAALMLALGYLPAQAACNVQWPLWQRFADTWVQVDGRVLESSLLDSHSTSEGQAYALFFALVANDAERFEQIWRWSRENLAGNDPQSVLPAWLWGQGKDGRWQVQDANSASDADIWFAYALLEADRLWGHAEYRDDALALLGQVKAQEILDLPGLGPTLMPGPVGFVQPDHLWRLNPSYAPIPVLRRLVSADPDGPWQQVVESSAKLLNDGGGHGFAADWVGYRGTSATSGLFVPDPFKGDIGSYDAIRVYLWAGMTDPGDPLAKTILGSLRGMARATAAIGMPPEKVAITTGKTDGRAPFGFSAALVPFFQASAEPWLAEQQQRRALEGLAQGRENGSPVPIYYDYMLSLFGLGWAEQRYRFDADGRLEPSWESACSVKTP